MAVPGLLSRWKHEITIAIIRRQVAILRAVLPKPGARELWILSGTCDESGFGVDGRLPSIEEELHGHDEGEESGELAVHI